MQKQASLAKGDNMNYKNNSISLDKVPGAKTRRRFVRSLEYEMLANLTLQNFQKEDGSVDFEKILSIPGNNRVPGLIAGYGMRRMHQLITLILKEFCYTIALPKSKKLTETKTSVCACDLILTAHEDYLSLEDLILFFER